MNQRPCPCGSGQPRHANYDARGIFLAFTCSICHQRKMATYRPDVLRNRNYQCDEPIEED